MKIPTNKNLAKLPPYLFAEIDKLKNEAREAGKDIISLSIGDPDLPTPAPIVEKLASAAKDPSNHQYPSYQGKHSLREAFSRYYKKRFKVTLDASSEVLSLVGTKEGIFHLPFALLNQGEAALVTNPGYPVYEASVVLAGGEVIDVPIKAENAYLVDFESIAEADARRGRLLYLNYPQNPTGAVAPKEFFERAVSWALRHEVVLVHDLAYADISFGKKPVSILEVDGARESAIEFYSLSKTFNMTGWRIGFACGNADIVGALGKIKTNADSGIFGAIQDAGAFALDNVDQFVPPNNEIYKKRRDMACQKLASMGLKFEVPEAAFYIWIEVPGGKKSTDFVGDILRKTGVVMTPGTGFGSFGEGYFRICFTVEETKLKEALGRLADNL